MLFIKKFKFAHKKELEHIFTSGNCYYFAVILKDRFGGEIYYLPIANHFVCKIKNKFYDILGEAGFTEKPYLWANYKSQDEKSYIATLRNCILFSTRK